MSMLSPQALLELQKKYVLFPWAAQNKAHPMHIQFALGCRVTFFDGSTALDFNSSVFNAAIGYDHPALRTAFERYAQNPQIAHPALIHEEKAKLGQTLARISPSAPDKGLIKSFLCLGGAEANENAIKIARMVTGKFKIMTRYRSYHGATLATLGYSGDYRRIPFDGAVQGVVRFPDVYPRGSGQQIDTVRLLEEMIEIEGPETIAAILLESITGANGVFVPPHDYFKRIRELCDKNNILLIADEVFSGFGRTGSWFGIDHFGVTPDILTAAKGITGGYAPLGVCMVNEKIAHHFDQETLWCGLTSYGHPLSAAIANATIEVIENECLIENAAARGEELKAGLHDLQKNIKMVAEVRALGLMAAIDLQKSAQNNTPFVPYRAKDDALLPATRLAFELRKRGLLCTVRFGTVILAPPLCVTSEEIKEALSILSDVLYRTQEITS